MNKNNFKAIIFRLKKGEKYKSYYYQLIEFVKLLGRPELKIGLVLPKQEDLPSDSGTNPFLQATRNLGVSPAETLALLSQPDDIRIARDSGFALIAGWKKLDKKGSYLLKKGADIQIQELADLNIEWIDRWFNHYPPHFLETADFFPDKNKNILLNPQYLYSGSKIMKRKVEPVFFFDYDGTLTPIAQEPDLARLSSQMKNILQKLAEKYKLALVSGRGRKNLEDQVEIPGIFYAGNHGLDIKGPEISMIYPKVKNFLPLIENISKNLDESLSSIPGVIVEKKKMSVAIHYRQVSKKDFPKLKEPLKDILKGNTEHIRLLKGKKVIELLPNIEWNKGKAVLWIMNVLGLDW
ncbi:MAG: trehalose-phosphatase, partial [Candidatus Caldatribacteriota bacterium]|nr:trehalose-phosphatase [Candidatus Caldatribacteriota bacterium]